MWRSLRYCLHTWAWRENENMLFKKWHPAVLLKTTVWCIFNFYCFPFPSLLKSLWLVCTARAGLPSTKGIRRHLVTPPCAWVEIGLLSRAFPGRGLCTRTLAGLFPRARGHQTSVTSLVSQGSLMRRWPRDSTNVCGGFLVGQLLPYLCCGEVLQGCVWPGLYVGNLLPRFWEHLERNPCSFHSGRNSL